MKFDVTLNEWRLRKGQDFFGGKLVRGIFLSKGDDEVMIELEDFELEFFTMCCNLWEKWHEKVD